jgi:hypothetical protein
LKGFEAPARNSRFLAFFVGFSRFLALFFSAFLGLLNALFLYRIKTYEVLRASRANPILGDSPQPGTRAGEFATVGGIR